jgi:hypothetical protein
MSSLCACVAVADRRSLSKSGLTLGADRAAQAEEAPRGARVKTIIISAKTTEQPGREREKDKHKFKV